MSEQVLICLPYGGAGASFFQGWRARLPAWTRVLPVQLPGREERFAEPALIEMAAAVDEAYELVSGELHGGDRVALFGHSMGAILAYELARRLCANPAVHVARLVVSGSPDPWNGRRTRLTGLPDEEFLSRLEHLTGYAHPALADPEVRELVLPVLRADTEMHENYRPTADAPLSVPVTAVRGRLDRLVSAAANEGWAQATTGPFDTVEFDGGHMYLVDAPDALLDLVGPHTDRFVAPNR